MDSLENTYVALHETLGQIEEELGGDIVFLPSVSSYKIELFEEAISGELPLIFKYFYTQETNGLIIDNKRIYSLYVAEEKKTWVENLERMNNPETSPWFKGRPHIFKDYIIIGNDGTLLFCISRKYEFEDPVLYMCKNPNSEKGVNLELLSLNLRGLIQEMVKQAF